MSTDTAIPDFTLFGETGPFPDVVHCERFSDRAPIHNWQISAHRHTQITQLFVIDSGQVNAVVDGQSAAIGPDEFLYVPATHVHRFAIEPDTEGQIFSLPGTILTGLKRSNGSLGDILSRWHHAPLPRDARQTATLLAATMDQAGAFRAQRAVGLAHALLASIAQIARDHVHPLPRARSTLAQLDRLVLDHMADGWTASDYAGALSMSTGHLSRLCRTATGQGSTAYIERRRMEEASRMLAFTQIPVSAIGYHLGFGDPSYFSKRFRLTFGASPTAYRTRFDG